MKNFLIESIILIAISLIVSCSLRMNDKDAFYYEQNQRKIFINEKICSDDISKLVVEIYWKDSLLGSSSLHYDKGLDSCYIECFPTNQFSYKLDINSYHIELLYSYAKEDYLLLDYKLKRISDNKILADTIIRVSNILDTESINRFNYISKIHVPVIDLDDTGYNYFYCQDYLTVVKAALYRKNIKDSDINILKKTAFYLDIILNKGSIQFFIPKHSQYHPIEQISKELNLKVSEDISKVYLLQTSMSGKDNASDFSFETSKEILDFMSSEYAYGFSHSSINTGGEINVPIINIGKHKYNFLLILWFVYVLDNGDYVYRPLGYTYPINVHEIQTYIEDPSYVKYKISPLGYCIDNLYRIDVTE